MRKKRKEFNQGEKIYFFKDNDFDKLTTGWINSKGEEENGTQYWEITIDKNNPNSTDDLNKVLYKRKDSFILNETDRKKEQYEEISKFLKLRFINKNTNYIQEIARLFTKSNTRLRISILAISNFLKNPIRYFICVAIFGLIKLVFGDIFNFFSNEHKMYELKKAVQHSKKESNIISSVGMNNNDVAEDIQRMEKDIENRKFENNGITRAMIAMVIAILSLIFSTSGN